MATVDGALLNAAERRTPERFVERLRSELGDDLQGVWLYGSRARRAHTGPESDVDVLVVTTDGQGADALRARLREAAEAENANPFFFSLQVYGLDELAERRAIEAFFEREVDRDRIVLAGDPDGSPGGEIAGAGA